jgi:N,N'-diacetyllegionaminate synthase
MSFFPDPDRCLVIAEVAQAHDGSLGHAHAFIDAAAKAGADAVKFQTHFADEESTPADQWRVKFSRQDATRMDYWRRMEFTPEEWRGLSDHCRDAGVLFLSSAFSPKAVDLLQSLDMPAWKVASGEVTNIVLLRQMIASGKPILLSSGMSSYDQLDSAVEWVRMGGCELMVFQCTTEYPTPPEKIGLNVMGEIQSRYGCPVGLSDHSGTIYPGLAAAVLGVQALEVHICFSKQAFGPDIPASLDLEDLKRLCEGVRMIESMRRSPLNKEEIALEKAELRVLFGRSLVAAHPLAAGTTLLQEHLALKKPGGGLGPADYDLMVGRTLKRAMAKDEPLNWRDVD